MVRETGMSTLLTVNELVNFNVKVTIPSFCSSFSNKDILRWIGIHRTNTLCNNI